MRQTDMPKPHPENADRVGARRHDFGRQVRDALLHLHDLPYLQTHPLTRLVPAPPGWRGNRGKELQRALQEAIQALRPDAAPGHRDQRSHRILTLRYAEALSASEVQGRLGVGESEYHRAHRRALDAVIVLLADRWQQGDLGADPTPITGVQLEYGSPRVLAPSGARGPAHKLPLALTSFVGRERELATLVELLRDRRLVTVTGPAGAGKTRLALEVAASLEGTFADGAAFVDLAPVADPAHVPRAIARALGVGEPPGLSAPEAVRTYLETRHVLLVLDNLDRVLPAAPEIAALLGACSRLAILATSRAALRVSGEQEFVLAPLDPPAPTATAQDIAANAAVALFLERARSADLTFRLSAENLADVAELCRRLDGLPLALTLAAARVRLLPPRALLARLSQRLDLLAAGSRDLPERHQTLRAALSWSFDLLTPGQRGLFRQLAVCVGGWTLADAEAVAGSAGEGGPGRPAEGAVLDDLAALVEGSLVRRMAGDDDEPRFGMLETLRDYGLEQLRLAGAEAEARRRHARYVRARVEEAEPGLRGPDCARWLDRLDADYANVVQALRWHLAEEEVEPGLRMVNVLYLFWWGRGRLSEGREWLDLALRLPPGDVATAARARALAYAGAVCGSQGDYAAAMPRLREALALAEQLGEAAVAGLALALLGGVEMPQGDLTGGQELLEQSLVVARAAGDDWAAGIALNFLGVCAASQNDLATARARWEESVALLRAIGDRLIIEAPMHQLGLLHYREGDHDRAQQLLEETLGFSRRLGHRGGISNALYDLGLVAKARGDAATAAALLRESLAIARDVGFKVQMARVLEQFAGLTAPSSPGAALELAGAASRLRSSLPAPLPPAEREALDRELEPAWEALGEGAAGHWEEGRRRSVDEAIALALALGDPSGELLSPP